MSVMVHEFSAYFTLSIRVEPLGKYYLPRARTKPEYCCACNRSTYERSEGVILLKHSNRVLTVCSSPGKVAHVFLCKNCSVPKCYSIEKRECRKV